MAKTALARVAVIRPQSENEAKDRNYDLPNSINSLVRMVYQKLKEIIEEVGFFYSKE